MLSRKHNTYKFEQHLKECRGAIHVGAHDGDDGGEIAWYNNKGFQRVMWFEPNQEIYKRLLKNIVSYPNQKAYNVGIYDANKKAILHISRNDGESSSILELGLHKEYYPRVFYIRDEEVQLMRMDTFVQKNKLDLKDFNFLNIDVQGVELQVIRSFGNAIKMMDYIYSEVNEAELYKGCCLVQEIDDYLDVFGFKRAETYMTQKHWGDALYVRKDLL